MIVGSAQAAFVVDADPANANFSFGGDTTTASASSASAAVGTSGVSLFGGDGTSLPDNYTFTYTPGTDADNFDTEEDDLLGSSTGFGTELASGVEGGASGLYNVYITAPSSTNVNTDGSLVTVAGETNDVIITALDFNDGGTGADLDPGPAFVGGANNAWFKLGTVDLIAGETYTVTVEANTNSFVSQRTAAVMWEAVPEPATASLLGLGALAMLRRRSA
jgi:hypothetical protein